MVAGSCEAAAGGRLVCELTEVDDAVGAGEVWALCCALGCALVCVDVALGESACITAIILPCAAVDEVVE